MKELESRADDSASATDDRWEKDADLDAVIESASQRPGNCPTCSLPFTSRDGSWVCSECGSQAPSSDIY